MVDRNLTLKEFWMLSEEERGQRYRELSDSDKFRVRMSVSPAEIEVPCNVCKYYHKNGTCDAYPMGISKDHLLKIIEDHQISCNKELRFERKGSSAEARK